MSNHSSPAGDSVHFFLHWKMAAFMWLVTLYVGKAILRLNLLYKNRINMAAKMIKIHGLSADKPLNPSLPPALCSFGLDLGNMRQIGC